MVYVLDNQDTSAMYLPQLTLLEDGKFVFVENLYEGMGTYVGDYTVQQNDVRCTVTACSFSGGGVAGGDVTELTFSLQPDGSLQLGQNLCYAQKDDIFFPQSAQRSVIGTVYVSQWDGAVQGCEPTIAFAADGSFTMEENLLDRMGTYTGSYDICGSSVRCVVHTCNFNEGGRDYAGANVGFFYFSAQPDGSLRLENDLGASLKGEIFAQSAEKAAA